VKIKVTTKEVVEREYEFEVELPIPADDAFLRRYIQGSASNGVLLAYMERTKVSPSAATSTTEERITRVESDLGQLYPRVRQRRAKVDPNQRTVDEVLAEEEVRDGDL
jgi:hypothetical protein